MSYRIEILSRPDSDRHQVKDFSIEWKRPESFKISYDAKIPEIILRGDDYDYFSGLEQDSDCALQTLNVYTKCKGGEKLRFSGQFSMNSGEWDLDQCQVKFKINEINEYTCIEDQTSDDSVNLFELGNGINEIGLGMTFDIEFKSCWSFNSPCDVEDWVNNQYYTLINSQELPGSPSSVTVDLYARKRARVPCDVELDSSWILIDSCTDDVRTYVKRLDIDDTFVYGEYYVISNNSYGFNDYSVTTDSMDNALNLQEAMESLLSLACAGSGLTLVSDFFQWNPENETSINYVTGESNVWINLFLFQKSDVLRSGASNNATNAPSYFLSLLEDLCKIFNLKYEIQGTIFRLEHISFFQAGSGINLRNQGHLINKMLRGSRKYEYNTSNFYRKETFKWMDSEANKDFIGAPITYDCSDLFDQNEKAWDVKNIYTDVLTAFENSNTGKIQDSGFVLVACDSSNNILWQDNIIDAGGSLNGVLTWSYLHDKLFKDGRTFSSGQINGVDYDFMNVIPFLKQTPFRVTLPCSTFNLFDVTEKIKGLLGWGIIDTAKYNPLTCVLELTLLLSKIDENNIETELGDFDNDFDNDFD